MKFSFLRLGAAGWLAAWPAMAVAQQPVAGSKPRVEVTYYDGKSNKLPSAMGASYRSEVQFEDSVKAIERTFYATGGPRSVVHYANYRLRIQHGTSESWYENGQLKWHDNRAQGKLEGELRYYYPTGKLKRRELYSAGARTEGACFGPDGKPVAFFEYLVMPVPAGGLTGLRNYISANINYPEEARNAEVQGKVLVSFVVDSTGMVGNVLVKQSVHPLLDAEAARVVQRLPRWTPGKRDGVPVPVHYAVPVVFRLEE
ncbi:TonB family protein [Hymenobacter oligotrophus]|uniref:TonB family protein n=1 Tax=Hymenobacter oligotrophus TaxID=2319843 RepID=A0A3B7R503_9BACT|nr:energy transducer TonB [Hymenobacter oligotrophus]AYA36309.1 TonB family protein [Hymenobacter oligotrophus]